MLRGGGGVTWGFRRVGKSLTDPQLAPIHFTGILFVGQDGTLQLEVTEGVGVSEEGGLDGTPTTPTSTPTSTTTEQLIG